MRTLDAKPRFAASKTMERDYYRQLRKIARAVGQIIELYQDGAKLRPGLNEALLRYAEQLQPWAQAVAAIMVSRVDQSNARAWKAQSKEISRAMKAAPELPIAQAIQSEQVALITSLPIEAGTRAQKLALEAATGGKRADEVAAEIARSGEVTESRAMLIARTEIAKANSAFTQARATSVGSTHYIWRTAEDQDVRESHAEMEGQIVAWDDPPTLSDGTTTHAGQIYNCRCWSEPLLD